MTGNNNSTNNKNIRLSKCSLGSEELEGVQRVFANEYLGMGKEVQEFEQEIKDFLDTDNQVVCVNSGTNALHLSLSCLDLAPGSEVLVPSITYIATYQAIKGAGLTPVSCDVAADQVFIDVSDAEKRITDKTKVILPVHYASDSSLIEGIYKLAKKYNLRVVEDAAQSFGSIRDNKKLGSSNGDIFCFSFDGIKNITCGEGGAIVTSDKKLAALAKDSRLLSVHKDSEKRYQGQRSWEFNVYRQGYRFHMSDIMAAIGRAQLKKIKQFSDKRQALVSSYIEKLKNCNGISLLNLNYQKNTSHIFAIRVLEGKRDSLADSLNKTGIATGMHYYPNHLLDYFKTDYSLPTTELLFNQLLTLPLHVDMSIEDVDFVVNNIKKSLNKSTVTT